MRLAVCGLLLLLSACVLPPVVYHEALPAQAPQSEVLALRGEYGAFTWNRAEGTAGYSLLGARVGGEIGKMAVDGGLGMLYTSPFIQMGVGLSRPAMMLRGMTTFDGWWQASLLVGPSFRNRGFNWSIGGISSRFGIGPSLVLENRWGPVTVRGQGSVTWRAPWADTTVQGSVMSFSLAVEPNINVGGLFKQDTAQPKPR